MTTNETNCDSTPIWKATPCDRVNGQLEKHDKGYFRFVRIDRDDEGLILAVVLKDNAKRPGTPPKDMVDLHDRANTIARVIRSRFHHYVTDKGLVQDYNLWISNLCATCQRGLLGEKPQPKAAMQTLAKLEESLIIAARPQRRKYVLNLFKAFASVVAIVLLLSAAYWLIVGDGYGLPELEQILAVQANTIIGLSFGVLFSGIVQNRVLTFKALETFDPNGFSTIERLLYVWVVASTLQIFIYFDVIVLGIGGTSFKDVFADGASPYLGILIGVVTAISTEAIAELIKQSAKPSNTKASV